MLVPFLVNIESARIVYKSLHGDAQSYMKDIRTKVNVITTRPLRNSDFDQSSGGIFGGKVIGRCHYQKKKWGHSSLPLFENRDP